jgi:hypothetical protein
MPMIFLSKPTTVCRDDGVVVGSITGTDYACFTPEPRPTVFTAQELREIADKLDRITGVAKS